MHYTPCPAKKDMNVPKLKSIEVIKLRISEKDTKFCEITNLDLTRLVYVVNIKSKVEISSIFVAFLEYLNFTVLIYTVPNAIVFSQIFPWLIVKPKSTAHS